MKVAVLLSSYNGEKYIKTQISSILQQKGHFNLDLWVRDDGSTDDTKKILQQYADQGKLKWYTGTNLGAARSFLDLIKHCTGYDYYLFSDQDDYWLPGKVESAINYLKKNHGKCVYFADAEVVDNNLNPIGRNVYKSKPRLKFETISCIGGILGCTMAFSSDLAQSIQVKSLPTNVFMHDFYVTELCLSLGGNIIFDPCVQLKYRQHSNNVVGVPTGFTNTIKNRVREITYSNTVSIASQAEEILRLYANEISEQNKVWLMKVASYKDNLLNRFLLSLSRKTEYANINNSITIRLSLLLGRR